MTAQQIRLLASKARRGDINATERLMNETFKQSKKLNARFQSLESHNSTNAYAYRRAKYFLNGGNRFSLSKKLTIDQMESQLIEVSHLMGLQTSTYRGYKKQQTNMIKGMQKAGIDITPADLETWEEFTSTDFFHDFVDFDSERTVKEGLDALREGKTVEDLKKAYNEYKEGKKDLIDVWEEWTEVPFV